MMHQGSKSFLRVVLNILCISFLSTRALLADLFNDDFCGDNQYWSELSGDWERTNCEYKQTSADEVTYTWVGETNDPEEWKDYIVTWTMKTESECHTAGVLVRSTDVTGVSKEGHQYFVGIGNDEMAIQKFENGASQTLASADMDADIAEQRLIGEVQVKGSSINAIITIENGQKYSLSVEDSSFTDGVVGLYTFKCSASFESIQVSSPDVKEEDIDTKQRTMNLIALFRRNGEMNGNLNGDHTSQRVGKTAGDRMQITRSGKIETWHWALGTCGILLLALFARRTYALRRRAEYLYV